MNFIRKLKKNGKSKKGEKEDGKTAKDEQSPDPAAAGDAETTSPQDDVSLI